MISFWKQIRLLLWKGVLVKSRQKFWLAIELLVPLILFVILALVRTRDFTDFRTQCHYDSKGFPSSGILPSLHSFLCSFSNTCHLSPTTGDETQFIHNSSAINESLLVDILYYSSLQLGRIGKNPTEFSQLLNIFTRLVKIFAAMNSTKSSYLPELQQFFKPSFNVTRTFEDLGLSQNVAEALTKSKLTPFFFIEAYSYGNEVLSMSPMLLPLKAFESIPLLCNETIFNSSFILPSNTTLTAEDRRSLCNITSLDLLALNATEIRQNVKILTPSDNSFEQSAEIANLLSTVISIVQLQPIYEGFRKWSHINFSSLSNITTSVFCGKNPFDISPEDLGPSSKGMKTAFDELKNKLISFIETVVPGKQQRGRQYCHGVRIHDDLNCSSLEVAVMQRLRPLFTGYILVTPPSPAVERLIDILNRPLRIVDFLRQKLFEYPESSGNLQNALYRSDLRAASLNILSLLRTPPDQPQPSWLKRMEFVLEHIFAPFSDPYSFGAITKNLTEAINKYTKCFLTDRFVTVANESILEETAMCLADYQQYFSGIVILNMTENATNFDPVTVYKIRHLPNFIDGTYYYEDSPRNFFDRNSPFIDLKYITYGFSFLQESIDRAIVTLRTHSNRTFGMYAQQEPFPCVSVDKFNVTVFFGLLMILSFIIPASLLVKNIVYEKELRLKEQMRIMGLGDMVHLWSWAIISLIFNLASILLITAIIKFGRVLPNVDFSLLFVFLALFAISSIALCLLISTFFSNANISTAATCMIYFLFFFPFQISIKARNKTFTHITLIFPQTTLGYGAAMISLYDEINKAKWKNIDEIYLEAYDVSLLECMVAFICEAIVFVILTWYKSAVSPGIYGVSLPWYFFLTRRYWLPSAVDVADFNPITDSQPAPSSNNFDAEPTDLPLTVNISGLSKVYSNGTKALDNLCLNLYEDQITALLGHNGAGKTTTMSILCGLYSPSNGTASIYGMDIRKEILSVREVLGVCPQYNVLFSHLTVAEQLKLFAALKGTPDAKIEQEVEEILNAISLMDKKRELASALSGGMKRRLCIGIALIGGSRFVILDEPTAGVDVMSRKEIWTLLQNNKKGRTILLSTHHMDEADILSDRIAILSEGKLISLGSSIFLKNRYGESFQVVACKENRTHDYTSIVTSIVTEATIAIRLLDHTEDELVFSIPISTNSVKLESFFANFDSKKKAYMIAEYGISAPTLQEIFVRLCPHREYIVPVHKAGILSKMKKKIRRNAVQNDQQQLVKLPVLDEDAADAGAPKDDSPQLYDEGDIPVLLSGWRLRFTHIKALLNCRWRYTIRSKKLILFEVVLPILLLFYCELYAKIQYGGEKPPSTYQPPLPLVAELFGNDTNAYVSLWDRNPESLSYQIMHSLVEPPDMGTRCVNNVPVIRRRMGVGCNREAGNGTFNWNVNRSTIPYNENVACQCTEHHVWNCTLEDYPFERIPNLTLNSTVKLWDMSYRNISQMRMVSRWSRNETSEIVLVLGGLSLGHTSVRARTPPEVVSEIEGWQNFVAGLNRSAAALNINVTKSESPSIYDPFLKNMTTLDFITGVVKSMETKENVKAWFNNKLYTSLPTFVGILSNALLRVESKGLDPSNLGIITINHPMNQTLRDNFDNEASGKLVVFRITLIMLVLCVIPAGFTVFLVEERVCDAFHLQLVSGLSRLTYWITGYAFDMSVYTISIIAVLMIYVIFGVQDFAYNFGSLGSFFLVFFLHGLCAVLWAYIFQRRFQVPALSFVLISVGTFFVGIVAVLTVVIIEQLMQEDRTLLTTHGICSTVFLIIPPYNLGMAIFRGVVVSRLAEIGENFLRELNRLDLLSSLPIPSLLEWSLMGIHCFCLIIHITIAAVILCIIEGEPFEFLRKWEKRYTRKLVDSVKDSSDADVIAERKRVAEMEDCSEHPLIVKNLAKLCKISLYQLGIEAYSKKFLAVRDVTFAVDKGECFGLLGLNGAGKTTTFSILTQKIRPGRGLVLIHGRNWTSTSGLSRSLMNGGRSVYDHVGYCPQFDAMNMKLTTDENIELFARIRGIPEDHIRPLVNRLLLSLHLQPYASTVTSALSGGNRRKLSVAIALISYPSLVLLDEPSAGMDPDSQQFLWKVIGHLRKSGRAVVITSHSMEECEALCTRIAIMDRGQIRCIGSKQHLKNKFGEGHSLTLKMRSHNDAELAAEFVLTHLEGAKIESIHCSTLFLHISRDVSTISGIYSVVNKLKKEFPVEDFSLSQSTLAEVFHSLAANISTPTSSNQAIAPDETDLVD